MTAAKRRWRIAAVQLPACSDDPAANIEAAAGHVRAAARAGAEIVLLPELATLPYFCDAPPAPFRRFAERRDGPTVTAFAALCRELAITLLLPFYERDAATGRFYNSVVAIGPTGRLLPALRRDGAAPAIRKLHLPAGEARHFAAGDGLGVFVVGSLRIGCLICYDRRFPECWRELRALGADLVAVPVAGSGGDSVGFYLAELRTHARENGVMALAANKTGEERVGPTIVENYGESCVVSAEGDILALRPGAEGPGVIIAEIDLATIAATRRRFPYFEGLRRDLFGGPGPLGGQPPAPDRNSRLEDFAWTS